MVIVAAQTQDHGHRAELMIHLLQDTSATVLIGGSSVQVNLSNVIVMTLLGVKAAQEKIAALVIVVGIRKKNNHSSVVRSLYIIIDYTNIYFSRCLI